MNVEHLIQEIASLGLNLYDFALYTSEGVFTHRFQPCNNCADSYSVAKLFVVTALGMLWDEGRIRMDDPLSLYYDIPESADPRWRAATIENAVTHRLGFGEGFLDIDAEDVTEYPTDDYLSMVFAHPLSCDPGTEFQYSDAAYYLLSRLISKVSGEGLDVFLSRRLLKPLRFHEAAWSRCPQEYPIGATGLYISAADMVKLPALYMQHGLWHGQRILSKAWVDLTIERRYELNPLTEEGSFIGKGGMYGQMAAFSKDKQIAVAWHAHQEEEGMDKLKACLDTLI